MSLSTRRRTFARRIQGPHRDVDRVSPAETVAMLFWAFLASSQTVMGKVDGWQTLGEALAAAVPVDLAA